MAQFTEQIERPVKDSMEPEWLLSVSSVIGSEPGVKSFGAARVLQHGQVTVIIIDRFHRNKSIYEIEGAIRDK